MDAATLHDAIAEVCPTISTSVGKSDDRATWSFIPVANATQPQIDAGNNVIATIAIDAEFVSRFEPTFDMGDSMYKILTG